MQRHILAKTYVTEKVKKVLRGNLVVPCVTLSMLRKMVPWAPYAVGGDISPFYYVVISLQVDSNG